MAETKYDSVFKLIQGRYLNNDEWRERDVKILRTAMRHNHPELYKKLNKGGFVAFYEGLQGEVEIALSGIRPAAKADDEVKWSLRWISMHWELLVAEDRKIDLPMLIDALSQGVDKFKALLNPVGSRLFSVLVRKKTNEEKNIDTLKKYLNDRLESSKANTTAIAA
jgi:hypothetical protein